MFPYARLGGRYEGGSSISFQQSGGVPLEVVKVDGEFSTLSYLFSSSAGPQIMKVVDHEQFTPSVKGSMDPHKFDPSQPLLAIRLTYYKDATVVCLCAQHAAVDFGGMITFLKMGRPWHLNLAVAANAIMLDWRELCILARRHSNFKKRQRWLKRA